MNHYSDGEPEQRRPSLLPTGNLDKFPIVNILSNFETHRRPEIIEKSPSRIAKFSLSFVILSTMGIAVFAYFSDSKIAQLDSISPRSNSLSATSSTTAPENQFPISSHSTSPIKSFKEIPTPSSNVADDDKVDISTAALLIDVQKEERKVGSFDDSLNLANIKPAESISPRQKQKMSINHAHTKQKKSPATNSANNFNAKVALNKPNRIPKHKGALARHSSKKVPAHEEKSLTKAYDSDIVLLSALITNGIKNDFSVSKNQQSDIKTKPVDSKKSSDNAITIDQVKP